MVGPEEVLSFWLDDVGEAGWYVQDADLDAAIQRTDLGQMLHNQNTLISHLLRLITRIHVILWRIRVILRRPMRGRHHRAHQVHRVCPRQDAMMIENTPAGPRKAMEMMIWIEEVMKKGLSCREITLDQRG